MNKYNSDKRIKKKSRSTRNIISVIFLSLVALLALSFCIALLLTNAQLRKEEEAIKSELDTINQEGYYTTSQTQQMIDEAVAEAESETKKSILEQFKSLLTSGQSTIAAIRAMFTDQLVVADSGNYYFFPITDELAANGFNSEDFTLSENGIMSYTGTDSAVSGELGIDVSKFQGEIDWEKVAAAGVKYAFIRVGLRGSTEGALLEDDNFVTNIEGAIENGIDVGVYFYTQAITVEEAKEEAQFVLDLIEPYNITYPIVLDVESTESSESRTSGLSQETYTECAKAFCEMVSTAGYTPMIYGNVKSFTLLLDMTQLTDYEVWIAYYGTEQYYPYAFDIWQYSSEGVIDGIDGDVDLNISVTDYTP
ncbi:MAG: glycoside hydrolase family 25 protein [Butyrivibrio sp.]|nr:glycoside hydrolase family 25 protein [Butyrivibrio sp.]